MTWTNRIDFAGFAWHTVAIILFILDIISGNIGSSAASVVFFNFLGTGAFLTTAIMGKSKFQIWVFSCLFFFQFVCLYGVIFS